ncbi:MAG: glycoside hydrolase, partial [Oscillospiraceae bacterium]|nr:glycoside hydrolase [Oscillospiraceae bacterium]
MGVNFKKIKAAIMSAIISTTAALIPFSGISENVLAADNDNYAKLLQHSLYFYDANMCGNEVGTASQLT